MFPNDGRWEIGFVLFPVFCAWHHLLPDCLDVKEPRPAFLLLTSRNRSPTREKKITNKQFKRQIHLKLSANRCPREKFLWPSKKRRDIKKAAFQKRFLVSDYIPLLPVWTKIMLTLHCLAALADVIVGQRSLIIGHQAEWTSEGRTTFSASSVGVLRKHNANSLLFYYLLYLSIGITLESLTVSVISAYHYRVIFKV